MSAIPADDGLELEAPDVRGVVLDPGASAAELHALRADIAEARQALADIYEHTSQLHALALQLGQLVEQFGPIAAQLAQGGPGALIGLLGRRQG